MLTALLKQTPEYKRLLAGMAGAKPAVVALFGMPPTARAQMLAALCEDTGRSALVVCAGEADATRFAEDAAVFGRRAEVFPARDYVLRPVEGQSHEYEYRRLAVLGNLVGGRTSVACAPVEAVLQYTTPKQEFCGNTLTVKQGMAISMDVLIERLFGAGYLRRFQVDGPGQFSVRGGIVDIYAPDMQKPHRLEFWGDEVDSIHSFDLVSQRREGAVKKIYLSPAREVLFGDTEAAARLLRTALSKAKPAYAEALADAMDGDLKALDAGTMPAAMDKYLALRYEKPATIFEYFDAPIVFLTAKAAEEDAVFGLGVGADDYVRKPFGAAELRAKVAAHLRREKRERVYALAFGDVRLDLAARELYVGEARVALTKTEFDVCEFLARHPGQVFSRDQIVEGVLGWGAESDAATISVHVSNARAKLKAAGAEPVQTVWGVGDKWIA